MSKTNRVLPEEIVQNKIFIIRNKKVMIDSDLAMLYGVETKNLNKAVKRNIERFPEDFMFQLTKKETHALRFQIGTSKTGSGGRRYLPYVFTQEGVAMLSSVLNSDRAIHVNIQIMRAFVKLRELMTSHTELRNKIEDMEKKYDYQFKIVFDAIKRLLEPPAKPEKPIGFHRK
ncbi:MAG: ORF6N domain-containing protein [Candidatus Omnitrophota bacterium]